MPGRRYSIRQVANVQLTGFLGHRIVRDASSPPQAPFLSRQQDRPSSQLAPWLLPAHAGLDHAISIPLAPAEWPAVVLSLHDLFMGTIVVDAGCPTYNE